MYHYKSTGVYEDVKNNLYVFGPHQYALYYWQKAAIEGNIKGPSLLIHIDLHSDFMESDIEEDGELTPKAILNHIKCEKITNQNLKRSCDMLKQIG